MKLFALIPTFILLYWVMQYVEIDTKSLYNDTADLIEETSERISEIKETIEERE